MRKAIRSNRIEKRKQYTYALKVGVMLDMKVNAINMHKRYGTTNNCFRVATSIIVEMHSV